MTRTEIDKKIELARQQNDTGDTPGYHERHVCCPQCGGKNISTTTMGCLIIDFNSASCVCGWHGIGHDLTPEKK